jgi:hypothetical protein
MSTLSNHLRVMARRICGESDLKKNYDTHLKQIVESIGDLISTIAQDLNSVEDSKQKKLVKKIIDEVADKVSEFDEMVGKIAGMQSIWAEQIPELQDMLGKLVKGMETYIFHDDTAQIPEKLTKRFDTYYKEMNDQLLALSRITSEAKRRFEKTKREAPRNIDVIDRDIEDSLSKGIEEMQK